MKKILYLVIAFLSSITYFITLLFHSAYISLAMKIEEWTSLKLIDRL